MGCCGTYIGDTRKRRANVLRHLRQRAAALGFHFVNGQTGEIIEGVS
jgi:hypothetical protein